MLLELACFSETKRYFNYSTNQNQGWQFLYYREIPHKETKYNKGVLKKSYSLGSLLNRVLGVFACSRALRVYVLPCSHAWRACVLTCLSCLRAYVLSVLACLACCVLGVFACSRAWRTFVLACLTYVLAVMGAWHAQHSRTRVFV